MFSLPEGLEDVSKYPYLTAELIRRNYTDEAVLKINGLNFIRVFRAIEKVSTYHSSWEIIKTPKYYKINFKLIESNICL